GGVGISLVTTLLDRGAQAHQALMRSRLTPYDPVFRQQVQSLGQAVGSDRRAYGVLYNTLLRQASLCAYVDNFRLFALIVAVSALSVVLVKKVKSTGKVAVIGE